MDLQKLRSYLAPHVPELAGDDAGDTDAPRIRAFILMHANKHVEDGRTRGRSTMIGTERGHNHMFSITSENQENQ